MDFGYQLYEPRERGGVTVRVFLANASGYEKVCNFKERKRSRSFPRTPSLALQASMLAIDEDRIMASHDAGRL